MAKRREALVKRNKNSDLNFCLNDIEPLTDNQELVLMSKKNQVLCGSAGTGKTFLASWLAFNSMLTGRHKSVTYLRSAVSTRDIGFLPGTEKEKMAVYEAPYADICTTLFDRGDAYNTLKLKEKVVFKPTSFIRGLTLRDTFIIADECQNMSYHELDTLITRLDDNCQIIFCGDIAQADLLKNGFADFYKIISRMNEFNFVEFTIDDVVRGDLVKSYLKHKAAFFSNR